MLRSDPATAHYSNMWDKYCNVWNKYCKILRQLSHTSSHTSSLSPRTHAIVIKRTHFHVILPQNERELYTPCTNYLRLCEFVPQNGRELHTPCTNYLRLCEFVRRQMNKNENVKMLLIETLRNFYQVLYGMFSSFLLFCFC